MYQYRVDVRLHSRNGPYGYRNTRVFKNELQTMLPSSRMKNLTPTPVFYLSHLPAVLTNVSRHTRSTPRNVHNTDTHLYAVHYNT